MIVLLCHVGFDCMLMFCESVVLLLRKIRPESHEKYTFAAPAEGNLQIV